MGAALCVVLALLGFGSRSARGKDVGMGVGAGAGRRLERTSNEHEFAKDQTLRRTVDRGVS